MLVVGGGIAGVSLASLMQKYSEWEIDLVERSPEWRTGGYNIGLWMGAMRVLDALGIRKEFEEKHTKLMTSNILDSNGNVLGVVSFEKLTKYGTVGTLHKGELHNLLIRTLPKNSSVRFNTTVEQIVPSSQGTAVTFTDGQEKTYDLVVGADGVRSKVRELVFNNVGLKEYGWSLWYFWLPEGFEAPKTVSVMFALESILFFFPTRSSCSVGLIRKTPFVSTKDPDALLQQLKEHMKSFGPSAQKILNHVDPRTVYHDWLLYVDRDTWFTKNTVLIGDAQHGLSPIAGLGASFALEDAFVLSEEIGPITDVSEIERGLERFSARRKNKVGSATSYLRRAEKISMGASTKLQGMLRNLLFRIAPNFITNPVKKYLDLPL